MQGEGKAKWRLLFWQRTYLVTLALFLTCLAGGVLGVMAVSLRQSFDARCNAFLSRQHTLVQTMAEDIAALAVRKPDAIPELCHYHAQRCHREGLNLSVWQDKSRTPLYSNEPQLATRAELNTLQVGQRSWQVRLIDGRHVIFATTMLQCGGSTYTISASADMEDFFAEWRYMQLLFAVLAVVVSVVFAVLLYLILGRMSRPLRQLSGMAALLAGGHLSARAPGSVAARSDELGDLARTINQMADRVEQQVETLAAQAAAKQQLIDNLSHEMRTPLTAIGGYAEYIQRAELTPAELMQATDTIRFESKRLLSLANQLVRLSVLAHEPPALAPLDPAAPALRAVNAVQPKADKVGVEFQVAIPVDLPQVLGDAELLESLFINLLDNGIKACCPGGQLCLRAAAAPQGVLFTIADNGCGMPPQALGQLGSPFYRADKARSRAQGGAGLGVALCKAVAAAHSTELHYASATGKGTTVEFTLPFTTPKQSRCSAETSV